MFPPAALYIRCPLSFLGIASTGAFMLDHLTVLKTTKPCHAMRTKRKAPVSLRGYTREEPKSGESLISSPSDRRFYCRRQASGQQPFLYHEARNDQDALFPRHFTLPAVKRCSGNLVAKQVGNPPLKMHVQPHLSLASLAGQIDKTALKKDAW